MKMTSLIAVACLHSLCVEAHVTVWPRTTQMGEWEKYIVRVPTEGMVATASVELQIPEGVYVVSMGAADGFTYQLRKSGKRTTAIVWSKQIAPGEFAEFAFMARNPADGDSITWKATQRHVDGSVVEWSGPPGDAHPASVTRLIAR